MYGFGEGGGAALNFKVVPGLTQPGTAAEKTIWVKTEKIGAWYFSATQPEGMKEWDVWISTGTSSQVEFNALKKNGIQVYPISAKQYVNGVWVDKTVKTYQGGKWVEWWDGYYFKEGRGSSVGKWSAVQQSGITHNLNYATISDNYIGFTWGAQTYTDLVVQSPPIDVSDIKTLFIDALFASRTSLFTLGLTKEKLTYSNSPDIQWVAKVSSTEHRRKTLSLDVSTLYGRCYITVLAVDGPNNHGYVYNVWEET